jgi:hypothetical protein
MPPTSSIGEAFLALANATVHSFVLTARRYILAAVELHVCRVWEQPKAVLHATPRVEACDGVLKGITGGQKKL